MLKLQLLELCGQPSSLLLRNAEMNERADPADEALGKALGPEEPSDRAGGAREGRGLEKTVGRGGARGSAHTWRTAPPRPLRHPRGLSAPRSRLRACS